MKQYFEIQPHKLLGEYVKRYWILDVSNPKPGESINKIIPEGLFEIVINYKDDYFDKTNGDEKIPQSFINGPFNKYRIFETKGDIGIFAIDFTPVGWYALTHYEGSEFTEKVISTDLLYKPLHELSKRLLGAKNNYERIELSNLYLTNLLKYSHNLDYVVYEIERDIKIKNGNVNIKELSRKHYCSISKLERNFKRITGLTPKKYAKLIRFRTILEFGLVKDWADFVIKLGFYDQAHFIKEFKSFIGVSPQKYFQHKNRKIHYYPDKRSFNSVFKNTEISL